MDCFLPRINPVKNACRADQFNREKDLECDTERALIVETRLSVIIYSALGAWFETVFFPKEPHEVKPAATGLVVYTARDRFGVLLSHPSTVPACMIKDEKVPLGSQPSQPLTPGGLGGRPHTTGPIDHGPRARPVGAPIEKKM